MEPGKWFVPNGDWIAEEGVPGAEKTPDRFGTEKFGVGGS